MRECQPAGEKKGDRHSENLRDPLFHRMLRQFLGSFAYFPNAEFGRTERTHAAQLFISKKRKICRAGISGAGFSL
jgi:hypothetical protein